MQKLEGCKGAQSTTFLNRCFYSDFPHFTHFPTYKVEYKGLFTHMHECQYSVSDYFPVSDTKLIIFNQISKDSLPLCAKL